MKFLTAAVGIIAALTACGETFSLNSPNDWDSAQKIAASDGVLSLPGNAILKSKKLFPVDPAKKYTLSAIVRNGTKGKSPRLHIGLIPYNAKKQQITAAAMSPQKICSRSSREFACIWRRRPKRSLFPVRGFRRV